MTNPIPWVPCAMCPDRACTCPDEQPDPTPNDSPAIVDLVLADLGARDRLGRKRYGTRLQAHNGRDALRDAYEEALDLAIYLRQVIAERDAPSLLDEMLAKLEARESPLPDVTFTQADVDMLCKGDE